MAKLICTIFFYGLLVLCLKGVLIVHEKFMYTFNSVELVILDLVSIGISYLAIEGYISLINKYIQDDYIQEQERETDD